MARAYLDHAATAPMPPEVRRAYLDAACERGNPASVHGHGQAARARLEEAREALAARLGCDAPELILTSGGTEAINLGVKGLFWARRRAGSGPVVLVSAGEHPATGEAARWLAEAQGARVRELPLDADGVLQPAALAAAIEDEGPEQVALVAFLWASNEVGSVSPVASLCAEARSRGVPVHVDAVAAWGQVPIDFGVSGASALSVSGHKIGAPVGVGALVLARDTGVEPLLHGGAQQRSRSGTQNVAGAVAFARAAALAMEETGRPRPERVERMRAARDRVLAGIRAAVPDAVVRGALPGTGAADTDRLPGNVHVTIPGCEGDALLFLLDAAGVSVSTGSACQAGVSSVSHVLLAMGVSPHDAAGALRVTVGAETEDDEIHLLLAALPDAVARARAAGVRALASPVASPVASSRLER